MKLKQPPHGYAKNICLVVIAHIIQDKKIICKKYRHNIIEKNLPGILLYIQKNNPGLWYIRIFQKQTGQQKDVIWYKNKTEAFQLFNK